MTNNKQQCLQAKVSGISKVHEGTLRVIVERFKRKITSEKGVGKKVIYSVKRKKSYLVVCEKNDIFKIGDPVLITSTKKQSKRKNFKVIRRAP